MIIKGKYSLQRILTTDISPKKIKPPPIFKKLLPLSLILLTIMVMFFFFKVTQTSINEKSQPLWQIRSIDTVKYSRDLSREKLNDITFDSTISQQVKNIQKTGATHIAIGTPYDDEFKPYLKRWIQEARSNNLKVWFRGNFSGWEKWFDYEPIDRPTHLVKVEKFILENPDLFEDGDIFTPCPECENGGPGDPRKTGNIPGYRQFLIDEYHISQNTFAKINKKVEVGYFSMNYDIAQLIMDPATTKALGGVVVIDHYVALPAQLSSDAKALALKSGGKIVFGELGAPIEDITGKMTETEQANWLYSALDNLSQNNEVMGINYWVNTGGSTQIWNDQGEPKKAVEIIKKYYSLTKKSS